MNAGLNKRRKFRSAFLNSGQLQKVCFDSSARSRSAGLLIAVAKRGPSYYGVGMQDRDSNRKFSISPDAVAGELDDGRAILNLQTSQYYHLNETGALIWEWVEANHSVGQMTEDMQNRFDVPLEDCRSDIIDVLKELEQAGLVTQG